FEGAWAWSFDVTSWSLRTPRLERFAHHDGGEKLLPAVLPGLDGVLGEGTGVGPSRVVVEAAADAVGQQLLRETPRQPIILDQALNELLRGLVGHAVEDTAHVHLLSVLAGAVRADRVEALEAEPQRIDDRVAAGAARIRAVGFEG